MKLSQYILKLSPIYHVQSKRGKSECVIYFEKLLIENDIENSSGISPDVQCSSIAAYRSLQQFKAKTRH